jgi:elongator complex protein 3
MSEYDFDYTSYKHILIPLLLELQEQPVAEIDAEWFQSLQKRHTRENGNMFSKDEIVKAYRGLAGQTAEETDPAAHEAGLQPVEELRIRKIRMKPTRTISGVTPVTVLTKPFPCPGKCIFCPNDVRMPKSYLSSEPGAQRAERNYFDPYLQTYNRLQALYNIGHAVQKAELIVLGGTWSYYPERYQIWFVKECFRALNEFYGDVEDAAGAAGRDECDRIREQYRTMHRRLQEQDEVVLSDDPARNEEELETHQIHGSQLGAKEAQSYNQKVSQLYTRPERIGGFDQYQSATWEELEAAQQENESARVRCVGLVIETRPDNISPEELRRVRRLGCAKTQIGIQSMQADVLAQNKRGHDPDATRRAFRLLREAGLKIHAHWMPNLYGSSVEADKADYELLFSDPDLKPDELKIYPCSLIESAELMQYHQRGEWQPYSHHELLEVLRHCFLQTPEYCRLTRVIRDIPSTDIVVGNKKTNFRQITEQDLAAEGLRSSDIRQREIRNQSFDPDELTLDIIEYEASQTTEQFLQFITPERLIVGFLRLSLPRGPADFTETSVDSESLAHALPELYQPDRAAMIREVHVYGQVVGLGQQHQERPQHLGLGTKLIQRAKAIAREAGFARLAVISAVGTRGYYRKKGFEDGELYQFAELKEPSDS